MASRSSCSALVTSLSALCLVLWTSTCMCLIALFNRASTHILRAFYSADIGVMNFSSPLDSIACCLMLVAGRPIASEISQLSATAQPDAICNNFAPEPTHNALHTQAWSPSPCSHTIPRDHASEFVLSKSFLTAQAPLLEDSFSRQQAFGPC